MHYLFSRLITLFFPPRCIRCGASGSALCSSCADRIPLAQPTDDPTIIALYDYGNRIVETAIRDIKYYRKKEVAIALLRAGIPHIASYLSDLIMTEKTIPLVFVPIPQHKKKLHNRGYNQSLLLAKVLVPFFDNARVVAVLEKHRYTLPQTHIKNKTERSRNIAHSMCLSKPITPHALYIIMDDVTTTGATIREAMRVLKNAGASQVCAIALAHGYARKK